mgnify:CR=1 FL=1
MTTETKVWEVVTEIRAQFEAWVNSITKRVLAAQNGEITMADEDFVLQYDIPSSADELAETLGEIIGVHETQLVTKELTAFVSKLIAEAREADAEIIRQLNANYAKALDGYPSDSRRGEEGERRCS